MRRQRKQSVSVFAVAMILLCLWLQTDAFAAETKTDIPVNGQVNGVLDDPPVSDDPQPSATPQSTESPTAGKSAAARTGDTLSLDMWLMIFLSALLMLTLLLLWRERDRKKPIKTEFLQ